MPKPPSTSRAVSSGDEPSSSMVASRLATAVLDMLGSAPTSAQPSSPHPSEAVRRATAAAAAKAATAAGALALPPGPLGWLTVLPELLAVWRIQAQLVADIAAIYGKQGAVTREQMLYCLFKHTASQAVRDLVVRAGERWLVKTASGAALQAVARRIGMRLSQQGVSKAASRWLPVVGAIGVAAYAYYDTAQVARAASELFSRPIEFESEEAAG
ncbi:EcsC family protein [Ideonella sp.]|uniref:EcsC family protein n=1 Tax=Ideonella sp. TaxID=1929293 RepID=UPI002B496C11|nr:EcsC family protein [Ideonella sp.]HJV71362.1 EcsC family protein [Ideonella sp.]